MSIIKLSRRQFLTSTSKASAAVAAAGAGMIQPLSASAAVPADLAHSDLLFALGERIALDAMAALGTETVHLTYFDHSGPGTDALRQGMQTALHRSSNGKADVVEVPAAYGAVLGVAQFQHNLTGETIRIEVFAAALSQLEMIRGVTASASLQKQSVMLANADTFYSVACV